MKRFTIALGACLVSLICCNAFPQDAPLKASHQALEEKVSAVLRADQPQDASERYSELFALADRDGLSELKHSPHDSIAIQAAWQEVALTVPETINDNHPTFHPSRGKLNWFVGFLEGRIRARVPQWWSEAVLDARANQRDNIYFPYRDWGQLTPKSAIQTAVAKKGEKFSLKVGNDTIELPNLLLKEVLHDGDFSTFHHFSAFFAPKHCYVAIYDDVGSPYTLACVDRSTEKLVWKTEGWGSWWYAVGGGVGKARVTVDAHDERVLVFACSGIGHVHAEGFRAQNGKNLFRFSNTYSEYRK
jgi:hypothetical protein